MNPAAPPANSAGNWSRAAGLARATDAFAEASGRLGLSVRGYRIGGRTIRVEAAGDEVLRYVHPSLAHLAVDADASNDLLIQLWDSRASGVPIPSAPGPVAPHEAYDDVIRSAFHVVPQILSIYHRLERRAVVWVPDGTRVPSNERASPLRTLLHWWSHDRGLQFVHGGAVALDGRAVLLAGPSGAGKSTAAIACLLGGLDYLGDDYVLVETGSRAAVHSLFSAGKVQPHHLAAFPELSPLVENADELPTEKALWFLDRHFPERLTQSAEAVAVLVPEVSDLAATTIAPLRPAAALAALAPSTIVQLSGADQASLSRIAGFLGQVPSYRLRSGRDLPGIARAVRAFLDASLAARG